MQSIIQTEKECYYCHSIYNLECHHIFRGAYRNASERNGLKVWLCQPHHTGQTGVHNGNVILDKWLKQTAQRKYEETHTREDFIREFGRSYL